EAIRTMKREGKTILFTSHNLYEVEELSDEIAIIAGGKIVAIGTPQEIKSKLGFRPRVFVTLRCRGDFPYGVAENGEVKIDEEAERPVQMLTEIIREAEARNCEVIEAAIKEPSLEEVVIKTISGR
ncbi:MAG: ABC transporter ATP-binding protein, partial [Thermoproteus sp.]